MNKPTADAIRNGTSITKIQQQQQPEAAQKTSAEVRHVDYLEWLRSLDWPPGKPRLVQFDPVDEVPEEEDQLEAQKSIQPPKIVVVETAKQSAPPPKSILKNSGRSSVRADEEEAQKLAWKLEYHQKKALQGSVLMSLASGADVSFTGTLIEPAAREADPATARPLLSSESHRPIKRQQHPLLTALIAEPPTGQGDFANHPENLPPAGLMPLQSNDRHGTRRNNLSVTARK